MRLDVTLVDGADCGQVEVDAREVRVRERDLDGQAALRAADVGEGLVVIPGKLPRDGARRAEAQSRHRAEEPFEPRGVCIERAEEVVAALDLVLRPPRPQRLGQRAPEGVETRVGHLQHAAHVGGARAVEKRRGLGRVVVALVRVAFENLQRDERVEKVARAARMQAETLAYGLGRRRPLRDLGEEVELDGAQKRLRGPEAEPQLHDVVGRQRLRHRHVRFGRF